AGSFVEDGGLEVGGNLPNNTSGGSLSEAYVHGINLIIEAVRQIRGTSCNQVPGAQLSLATSGNMVATGAPLLPGDCGWTTALAGALADPTGLPTGRPDGVASCASSAARIAARGDSLPDRCARAACRSRASGRPRAAARACSRGSSVTRPCCPRGRSARP